MTEAQMVERFIPLAHSVSWATVRRYPWSDFDDVYSDALLGLLKGVREWKPGPAQRYGYLKTKVESECRRGVRDRFRARRRNGHTTEEIPEAPVCGDDLAARDWLKRLPENERRAATLAGCGLLQREIADLLDVSQMTVSRWLKSALADWRAVAA